MMLYWTIVSSVMDTVPMDTVTPDLEVLSKNLHASLDPSLSNDERAIVYQVSTGHAHLTQTYN